MGSKPRVAPNQALNPDRGGISDQAEVLPKSRGAFAELRKYSCKYSRLASCQVSTVAANLGGHLTRVACSNA
jgi:hypothetical protein